MFFGVLLRGPAARVKLSLRMGKTERAPVLDWSKIKTDIARALQERYTVEVKNRFSILEKEDQTATERFEGSCIESTDRDIRDRKGKAWVALHRLKDIWKSNSQRPLRLD